MILEKGPGLRQSLRDLPKAVNRGNLTNGFVAAVFGMTAPLLLVLAATRAGNLPFDIVSSWLFVGYTLAGLSTIVQALYYRMPTSIAWTLPGTVLVGAALSHMGFDEVVGVYMTTAALLFILGATGLIRPLMARLPIPIAMGMVAGVFLPFGLHIIRSFSVLPLVAGVTVLAYVAFSWAPRISRQVPPLLGAILAGLLATTLTGNADWNVASLAIGRPVLVWPRFTWSSQIELLIPMFLSVAAAHNIQGISVLKAARYDPPVNVLTASCGLLGAMTGLFGTVSSCITGPTNAINSQPSSGPLEDRYVASIVTGLMWFLFGLISPVGASIARILPLALVGLLGGLALLNVLVGSFIEAFRGPFKIGAFFAFLITISNLSIYNIGAPFWGIVGGLLASVVFERQDFRPSSKVAA